MDPEREKALLNVATQIPLTSLREELWCTSEILDCGHRFVSLWLHAVSVSILGTLLSVNRYTEFCVVFALSFRILHPNSTFFVLISLVKQRLLFWNRRELSWKLLLMITIVFIYHPLFTLLKFRTTESWIRWQVFVSYFIV